MKVSYGNFAFEGTQDEYNTFIAANPAAKVTEDKVKSSESNSGGLFGNGGASKEKIITMCVAQQMGLGPMGLLLAL